ncbi:response regulator receiver domain protein [delta proteobacterium NaphS2]|nr:response regulator receiver domain protein [delta proteobacterium NaphS2]
MPVIGIFSGTFCNQEEVVQKLQERTDYQVVTDRDIVKKASELCGITENKVERAFSAKTSVFNNFTHEKERSIAHMKLAMAQTLQAGGFIASGFSSLLLPKGITHVLRVCLIADLKFRKATAAGQMQLSEKDATALIHKQDEDRAVWVQNLLETADPWSASLYDMVIPMDKMDVEAAASNIQNHLGDKMLQPSEESRKAAEDFLLAASVEATLTREGHNVDVDAVDGAVTITINKHVLMLSRLEEELKSLAAGIPGVSSVDTRVGKNYHQADIYRKADFQAPSKVLLVDDEREFVQTLSERLLMRDMGSAVAYDGESALKLVKDDEPEVMILDLKMPGIDGIEVLRRVKQTSPEIEVIILTGHGSEADRKVCMDLGAFAYLQKPVDIGVLTKTLNAANEKIRNKTRAQD